MPAEFDVRPMVQQFTNTIETSWRGLEFKLPGQPAQAMYRCFHFWKWHKP